MEEIIKLVKDLVEDENVNGDFLITNIKLKQLRELKRVWDLENL